MVSSVFLFAFSCFGWFESVICLIFFCLLKSLSLLRSADTVVCLFVVLLCFLLAVVSHWGALALVSLFFFPLVICLCFLMVCPFVVTYLCLFTSLCGGLIVLPTRNVNSFMQRFRSSLSLVLPLYEDASWSCLTEGKNGTWKHFPFSCNQPQAPAVRWYIDTSALTI